MSAAVAVPPEALQSESRPRLPSERSHSENLGQPSKRPSDGEAPERRRKGLKRGEGCAPEEAARAGNRDEADDAPLLPLADEGEQMLDGEGRAADEDVHVSLEAVIVADVRCGAFARRGTARS